MTEYLTEIKLMTIFEIKEGITMHFKYVFILIGFLLSSFHLQASYNGPLAHEPSGCPTADHVKNHWNLLMSERKIDWQTHEFEVVAVRRSAQKSTFACRVVPVQWPSSPTLYYTYSSLCSYEQQCPDERTMIKIGITTK